MGTTRIRGRHTNTHADESTCLDHGPWVPLSDDSGPCVDAARDGAQSIEAFKILRAASQSRNVQLREVAALIIRNLTGHPPADPPPFNRGPRAR
jgi:hypothetical protein